MEFHGEESIASDKETLWGIVSDPEVLASSVPGAEEVERVSETKYRATLDREISGFTISLATEIEITEFEPPDHIVAVATGEDRTVQSKYLPSRGMTADAELFMDETDGSGTTLEYHIEMEFTGPLAEAGAQLAEGMITADIETFFENIKERAETDRTE